MKFKWEAWDFDLDGEAYIIAKAECPESENVLAYLVKADSLPPSSMGGIGADITEGWCKYQVRTDWDDGYGEPMGGYYVETYEPHTKNLYGKRKPGWFPVWIVRKGDWCCKRRKDGNYYDRSGSQTD